MERIPMKSKFLGLLVLGLLALTQGCAGTNVVQATIPGGPLTLEPAVAVYAPTKLFISSPSQFFVLTNPSTNSGSAIITSVATESDQFLIESADSTCPTVGTLPAGLSCKIAVKFSPNTAGRQTATLTVTDGGSNSPQTASLVGAGMP
jgi:hypothetical protein